MAFQPLGIFLFFHQTYWVLTNKQSACNGDVTMNGHLLIRSLVCRNFCVCLMCWITTYLQLNTFYFPFLFHCNHNQQAFLSFPDWFSPFLNTIIKSIQWPITRFRFMLSSCLGNSILTCSCWAPVSAGTYGTAVCGIAAAEEMTGLHEACPLMCERQTFLLIVPCVVCVTGRPGGSWVDRKPRT